MTKDWEQSRARFFQKLFDWLGHRSAAKSDGGKGASGTAHDQDGGSPEEETSELKAIPNDAAFDVPRLGSRRSPLRLASRTVTSIPSRPALPLFADSLLGSPSPSTC